MDLDKLKKVGGFDTDRLLSEIDGHASHGDGDHQYDPEQGEHQHDSPSTTRERIVRANITDGGHLLLYDGGQGHPDHAEEEQADEATD